MCKDIGVGEQNRREVRGCHLQECFNQERGPLLRMKRGVKAAVGGAEERELGTLEFLVT